MDQENSFHKTKQIKRTTRAYPRVVCIPDHRESRERRDKIFAAKTENTKKFKNKIGSGKQFSVGNFHFFGRGKTNFFGGV